MKSIYFVKLVNNRKKHWTSLQHDYDNLPHLENLRLLTKKLNRKSFLVASLLACVGVLFVNAITLKSLLDLGRAMELSETMASGIESQSLTPFDATEVNYARESQRSPFLQPISRSSTFGHCGNAYLQCLSLSKVSSARLERWALTLQPYDFTITYSPAKTNPADYLPRYPLATTGHSTASDQAEEYIAFLANHTTPKAITTSEVKHQIANAQRYRP